MRPTNPIRLFLARALTAFLAWTMVLGPVQIAYAAPTPLADIPIASKVSAKPNIIFTLDDSGSMQYNYLPDYVVNAAGNINITLTRQGPTSGVYRARTNSVSALSTVAIGDWINVIGANQAEYNGFFKVVAKSGNVIEYEVGATAATPVTIAPGFSSIQIVTSAAYCRSGAGSTTCTQQPVNINMSGNTVITGSAITRPGPISIGGLVTATLTNTAANLATINSGDAITISNSTSSATLPGNTSNPYYGTFVVTKVNATTLTYQITAVANSTPLTAGNNKYILFGGSSNYAAPPLHAASFNRLAYNPEVNYQAPKKADGTPQTNTGTDANGNYATSAVRWSSNTVDRDPFAAYEVAAGVTPMWSAATKDNLSIRVAVPLYCNTDWPTLVNEPNGPATALDAGDVNGQYAAGTGAWCRINGTAYDTSAASGAPAATADYNYPWASSNGTVDAKFFSRQLSTKVLWCDTTSPYYPKSGTIASCYGGTPVGNSVQQTCVAQGNVCNPDPLLRNYNPAACKTDLPEMYCAPGTGGSGSNTPGTGSIPECLACSCVADTPPTVPGKCSITGATCNSGYGVAGGNLAQCPNQVTAITSCTGGTIRYANDSGACGKFLFDPNTNLAMVPATTMLQDANDKGIVCRHNNRTYAQMGAPAVGGLATYSRTNVGDVYAANKTGGTSTYGYSLNQTGAFTQQVTSGCPTVGTTVQIPRHYYVVDSVQFCNNRVATHNDQWRGFGAGTCVENNDLQQYKEVKYGKFTRIDLFPNNAATFSGGGGFPASATPYPMGRVWLNTGDPRPETSESVNYANWYAYYSTRLNAAKSTTATAFSYLTNVPPDPIAYRVGFHNLGEEPDDYGGAGTPIIWLDVEDWDATQRTAWYNKLFGIAVNNYKTPTLDAMMRIGNLVETGGSGGLAASINPLPNTAKDPFALKSDGSKITCQLNYHILFTDGKTNQVTPLPSSPVGDQDASIDASLIALGASGSESYQKLDGMTSGAWPAPFRQGVAVPNTLADVATYYWARDLRPSLKNDVPNQSGEKSALTCTGSPCTPPPYPLGVYTPGDYYYPALDPKKDVAWWQHVNFNAISFGAEGTLDAKKQTDTLLSIKSGGQNWPDLTNPYNPIYPKGAGAGAVAVDDLWHATMMSRGSFVFARSPVEVSYGLANILAGIQNQRKSRAGVAFGGQVLDAGNNVIFEPTIEVGWAGDLLKIEIDPTDGDTVQTWWSASKTLASQIDPIVTGVAEPWMDPAHRRIVTMNGTMGVPFQFANLSATQRRSLAPDSDTLLQRKIIAYLRGGNSYSGVGIEGTSIGQFRQRFGALGDISNAKPVIVFPPDRPYQDATDPGYSAYKTAKATRAPRVVAAANDGMVHVFDTGPMPKAATSTDPAVPVTAGGGKEIFAYIPKALFKGEAGTVNEDASGIQALTYQDGGVPIYRHHMYVDSSPRVADVDFGSGDDWRTIVVGGLGKGGNSYYALDLTDANASNESVAAGKVLWEWSHSDIKYTYGRPVIVKVRDSGTGTHACGSDASGSPATCRWVVIVTAGYDNVSGKGRIFFIDAKTGATVGPANGISTGVGDPPGSGQAAGLAQIHAFVKNQNNQVAEQIYGGDLLGNVWRVDVSAMDSYKTASAVHFATLTDPSGNAQPITTAPQIEIDINNGVDRFVFFGTGRLLDVSDLTSPSPPQTQTMYAIRDGTLNEPSTTGLPIAPRLTMKATNSDGVSAIVGGAPNGWYHDLPNTTGDSQRIVVDPQSNVNVAAYVGTRVQDDPCIISLPASLYARDYTTGEALTTDTGGGIVASIDFPKGLVDIETVGMIQPDGTQVIGIIGSQEIPGIKPAPIKNKFTGLGTRMSWRLLGGE